MDRLVHNAYKIKLEGESTEKTNSKIASSGHSLYSPLLWLTIRSRLQIRYCILGSLCIILVLLFSILEEYTSSDAVV